MHNEVQAMAARRQQKAVNDEITASAVKNKAMILLRKQQEQEEQEAAKKKEDASNAIGKVKGVAKAKGIATHLASLAAIDEDEVSSFPFFLLRFAFISVN